MIGFVITVVLWVSNFRGEKKRALWLSTLSRQTSRPLCNSETEHPVLNPALLFPGASQPTNKASSLFWNQRFWAKRWASVTASRRCCVFAGLSHRQELHITLDLFFFPFIWPAAYPHQIDFPWKCHEAKVIYCPMQDSWCSASTESWHEKWKGPLQLPEYMRHRQRDICSDKGSRSKFHLICFNRPARRTSVGRSGLVFDF